MGGSTCYKIMKDVMQDCFLAKVMLRSYLEIIQGVQILCKVKIVKNLYHFATVLCKIIFSGIKSDGARDDHQVRKNEREVNVLVAHPLYRSFEGRINAAVTSCKERETSHSGNNWMSIATIKPRRCFTFNRLVCERRCRTKCTFFFCTFNSCS